MSGSNEGNQFSFDKMFSGMFDGSFPFSFKGMVPDHAWIDNYVQEMLKKTIPQRAPFGTFETSGNPEVFETHRSVIVRMNIPKDADLSRIRVFHNPQEVRFEGLPDRDKLQVKLPALVNRKGASSSYQNGIMEVRLRKAASKGRDHEVQTDF